MQEYVFNTIFSAFHTIMAHSYSCLGKQAFSIFFMYDFIYKVRKAPLLCSLRSCLLGDLSSFSNPVSCIFWNKQKENKKKTRRKLQNCSSFFNWNQRPSGYTDAFLQCVTRLEVRVTIALCRILSCFSTEELSRKPPSPRAPGQLRAGLALVYPFSAAGRGVRLGTGWHSVPTKMCEWIKILCRLRLALMKFPRLTEGIQLLSTSILNEENECHPKWPLVLNKSLQ